MGLNSINFGFRDKEAEGACKILNVDVSFLFMRAACHFAVMFLCFAIIIKYTAKCDSIEVR